MPSCDYDKLIPPEVKGDAFYRAIFDLARNAEIKTILEIGSSSGEGSTEAFVLGLRENPKRPTLFCMEISEPRFEALRRRYAADAFVKPYRVSSVPAECFPSIKQVTEFYNQHLAGKFVPLPEFLRWLEQDLQYIRSSNVPTDGIALIKRENGIEHFDLVLIDGSEFTGQAELDEVYGARFILLDDINTFKNHANFHRLAADPNYRLREANHQVRGGYAIFERMTEHPASNAAPNYAAIRSRVQRIDGFMIPGQEQYLFDKVASLPDDAVILEIGSYKGRSTVAMGYACLGTRRRIFCVDTWDGNDKDFPERNFFDIWKQNLRRNGVEAAVQPLRGTSHDILSRWQELTGGRLIDFAFIDGSHEYADVLKDLQLVWPWVKAGGWIAFHDVHYTWPGPLRVWRDVGVRSLINHQYAATLACGQKPAGGKLEEPREHFAVKGNDPLPIHFFTIVLNGLPYLPHHIAQFQQLNFDWHWHIIEGVADLKHDTAWSLPAGGSVPAAFHKAGRSVDGTSEYLDQLAAAHPDRVTIYRKPPGQFWDGKLEMVTQPLNAISHDCLLWQIDADELWTADQFTAARRLFLDHPSKTAAFYWCWFFVGPDLVTATRNCYANNPRGEWLRTWRYRPGMRWVSHEPPLLAEPMPNGQWRSVAAVDPFSHAQTESAGLVFQHYAYATENQVRFKQDYYGYAGAVARWQALQSTTQFPVYLRDYFPWVTDETQVDRVRDFVAQKLIDIPAVPSIQTTPPPRILIDAVFFQLYQTGIARVWLQLWQQWLKDGFAKHLLILDRAGSAPRLPGLRYRTIPAYSYENVEADRQLLQQICDQEQAHAFISTYYTTPLTTPTLFMAHDMIPERFGWDLNHPMWREKHRGIRQAKAFVSVSAATKSDLLKFVPSINPDQVKVTPLAAAAEFYPRPQSEIDALRAGAGLTKPYFLTVGARGGYKNTILTFQALAKLPNLNHFDILAAGHITLEPEFQQLIPNHPVKSFHLTDDQLAAAYSGAIALLHPSTCEGFGLPVLEALACACPVITTKNGSLAEVAGQAALFVKDDDPIAMRDAMIEIQTPQTRKRLIEAGLKQANKFSWQNTADAIREELTKLANQPNPQPQAHTSS